MKKKLHILLYTAAALLATSCSYLDIDPELGITEKDVFSTYKNYKMYFDYAYPDYKKWLESNGTENADWYYTNIDGRFLVCWW